MNKKNLELVTLISDSDILSLDITKRKEMNYFIRYKQTVIDYIIETNHLAKTNSDDEDVIEDYFYLFIMESIPEAELVNAKFWNCNKTDIIILKGESLSEFLRYHDIYLYSHNIIGLSESNLAVFLSGLKSLTEIDLNTIKKTYIAKTEEAMDDIEHIAKESESYVRTKYELFGSEDSAIKRRRDIVDRNIQIKQEKKQNAEMKLKEIFGYGFSYLLEEETKQLLQTIWED